jgi:hypothetical protein
MVVIREYTVKKQWENYLRFSHQAVSTFSVDKFPLFNAFLLSEHLS